MIYPKRPKNVFSANDASKMLGVSSTYLYQYMKDGQIKYIQYKRGKAVYKAIHIDEINRIRKLRIPPKNSMTLEAFSKHCHYDVNTLAHAIHDLKILTTNQKLHPETDIGPLINHYYMLDLMKIHQNFYNNHGQHEYVRYGKTNLINFETNTTRIYNPKTDFNFSDMYRKLEPNAKLVNINLFYQWIIWGNLKNYNVDLNHKLYFTKQQAHELKTRYKKVPKYAYINNIQLANQLGIQAIQLTQFRKFYHIKPIRVLGINQIYYTKQQADQLIDWWQHKDHRPYPYHPNQLKGAN